jgi:hypothetical protein
VVGDLWILALDRGGFDGGVIWIASKSGISVFLGKHFSVNRCGCGIRQQGAYDSEGSSTAKYLFEWEV